jgi:hypothetical protein
MKRLRSHLTYANVISTLCLFIVLGGGAWAAATKLPKNSVGTPQLKANAVTGAKVKDDSLTGAQIQSGTLGTVPKAATAETAANAGHATSADTAGRADTANSAGHATSADSAARAGDATMLDGEPSSAFARVGLVHRLSYEVHWNVEPGVTRAILIAGPLAIYAYCNESEEGGAQTIFLISASGPAGSTIDYSQQVDGNVKAGVYTLGSTPTVVQRYVSLTGESLSSFATLVYRDPARTISVPLSMFTDGIGDICRASGSALVAE